MLKLEHSLHFAPFLLINLPVTFMWKEKCETMCQCSSVYPMLSRTDKKAFGIFNNNANKLKSMSKYGANTKIAAGKSNTMTRLSSRTL